jgi:hypothetical protein
MNQTDSFEAERPRLVRIASRVLLLGAARVVFDFT